MAANTKNILLWRSDFMETHGGEDNGGARTVLCPASGKNAFEPTFNENGGYWEAIPQYSSGGVPASSVWTGANGTGEQYLVGGTPINPTRTAASEWLTTKSYGQFTTGVGTDAVIGGTTVGQVNQFDYVSGMPDMRWEHFHVIDCEGYDYLTLFWKAQTIAYDGLIVDPAQVGAIDNYWADDVHVAAFGVPVIDKSSAGSFVNYPTAMWMNGNDGQGATQQGPACPSDSNYEYLGDPTITPTAAWVGAGGITSAGVCTANGTLTQTAANFLQAVTAGVLYKGSIDFVTVGFTGTMTITLGGVPTNPTQFTFTAESSTKTFNYTVVAPTSAPTFLITGTRSAGTCTIDNCYLWRDLTAGSNQRPRPFFTPAANSLKFAENYFPAFGDSLAVSGVPGAWFPNGTVTGNTIAEREAIGYVPLHDHPWAPKSFAVARGMFNYGRTFRSAAAGPTNNKIMSPGDRMGFAVKIGHRQNYSAWYNQNVVPGNNAGDLKITGLARIYVLVAKVGVIFSTAAAPTVAQSASGNNPATWLTDVGQLTGGATSPRQFIKGRLFAKLGQQHAGPR